jgi:arylsulfatase A
MNYNALKVFFIFSFWITQSIAQPATPPPNIIVIFCDDLGYGDLSSYGHPTIRTPQLDKMAAEGMRFTQFYVPAAVCTPSRAGLLTGRYPVRTGLVHGIMRADVLFPNDDNGLQPEEVTIAEVLKQKNYATMAIGKWHLGHLPKYLPTAQGFDAYYGVPYSNDMDHVRATETKPAFWNIPLMQNEEIIERPAEQSTLTKRYTEEAQKFIRENSKSPFFLYVAHSMPHTPIYASKDFEGKSKRGLYGDVIEELDWSVGEILKTLKELKLDRNTLVIFTSDNGPWLVQKQNGGSSGLLREGKGSTWEGGHRVPMIAWWPSTIPAGIINEKVASTLDILPTAASMANVSLPKTQLDGYNMLPVLKGEDVSVRDHFIFYRGDLVFAIRQGKWKAHFITQTAYPNGPLEFQYQPLLFDIENDPSEKYNVADKHPEIISKIKELKKAHEATVVKNRKSTLAKVFVPEIEGEWWDITNNPDLGKYTTSKQQPVDFAVWQAADGTFQLWSCIRGTKAGGKSRLFYRWEAKNITDKNWKPMGIAMEADTTLGEEKSGLQAPFVLKDNDRYLMFYGDWNRICLAESTDGKVFRRVMNKNNNAALFTGSLENTRDPMVLKIRDTYYCYYTGHLKDDKLDHPKSATFCRTSKDLKKWSEEITVSVGGSAQKLTNWHGGDSECPFVVNLDGKFILFRNQRYGENSLNTQYCSANPLNFGIDNDDFLVGELPYAAPEIIQVGDQYYMVALKPGLDGMMIARLKFVEKELK